MIEDLQARIAAETGLSAGQVTRALEGALGLMKKHAEPAKVAELYRAAPGSERLAERGAGWVGTGGGGLLGGLMKNVGGSGGKAISDGLAMQKTLKQEGVDEDQLKRVLPIARQWVRERAGGRDLLGEVVDTIPGIGSLLKGG